MNGICTMLNVAIDELTTIKKYYELLAECNCPTCADTLKEIIGDEWVHVGNALNILEHDKEIGPLIEEGRMESVTTAVKEGSMLSPSYNP